MVSLKSKLHEIIFEAETPAGKHFDIGLIIAVILSVVVVMLESVVSVKAEFQQELVMLEWFFTILFTIEYLLRLYCVLKPIKYATSFFGLVDLFSILPTYISLLVPGTQGLLIIRTLRLLRIFRVLKLHRFTDAGKILRHALLESRHKIIVFLGVVMTIVFIVGAVMYLVEGRENGFTSIPRSVYWAIVTMTTVGYGTVVPQTPIGQLFASLLMISGYGIIAVPTGIVSVEIANATRSRLFTRSCQSCSKEGHDVDAKYCSACGDKLV